MLARERFSVASRAAAQPPNPSMPPAEPDGHSPALWVLATGVAVVVAGVAVLVGRRAHRTQRAGQTA